MKFLVTSRIKDMFYTLPPEVQLELNKGAAAFIEKYLDNGKCKEIYNMPGKNMSMSIWEGETGEEMERRFVELSISAFMEYEVILLSDFEDSIKRNNEALEHMLVK
ncbi:Muconolactone delta-isomerase [Dethiosulfatibacter aminovorans DSM 17477]|uniref:Muconolactone delta-isomerase n=1 Tax=Dethiosulfatibacter aminovorans DSM 17477 TaxID=1121476 RepID=A0A1M6GAJ1_9FIRM|nr:muconolactone Delta-isomerase family protein [Dethiosulfatibacter aminovorans]SHJ06887.1 Muconolactone delta-isomerase [Dethiosulfatibacter aminovorans DSM 17477]